MSDFWHAAAIWTARLLLAGGAALLVAWLAARRIGDPARRQRVLAWAVRASVLACGLTFFPAWLSVPVPGWHDAPAPAPLAESLVTAKIEAADAELEEYGLVAVEPPADVGYDQPPVFPGASSPTTVAVQPVPPPAAAVPEPPEDPVAAVAPILLIPYWLGVAAVLLRQLVGHVGLARLRRAARPAGDDVQALAAQLADGPAPRVLVSDRVGAPVCFGVLRPTVLLPRVLPTVASPDQLRWVLAHELDHLRRGDTRTGVWAGLAGAVYFVLPWFWAVRRDLSLAQEYLADGAAAGPRVADYAAFLVDLSSRPGVPRSVRAVPSLAGVRAGRSDLYRRVTMLLQPKTGRKSRWGRAWSALALGSAVTAAVAASGVRLTADEPKKGDKPEEGRKAERRDGDRKPAEVKPDGDQKPADVRMIEVRVVDDGRKDTVDLEKAIEEAAKKGDVEAVKALVAKLKAKPVVVGDRGTRLEGRVVETRPVVGDALRVRVTAALDEETQKLEKAIEKLKQAAEEVKDQPEAKAALEKSIAEYRKKIAEAKKSGELRSAELKPRAVEAGQFQRFAAVHPPALDQMKASIDEMMKVYEKQLAAVGNDAKAAEALKESMKAYKASMDQLAKQLANPGAFQGQMQGQGFGQMQGQGFGQMQFQPLKPLAADNVFLSGTTAVKRVPASGRLGVMIEAVPGVVAEQLDLPAGKGVVLLTIVPESPAAKAGLKAHDILLEVAGKQVAADDLSKVVTGLKANETFEVIIVRKGKKETLKGVMLPEPKATTTNVKKSSSSSMSVNLNGDQFEIDAKQDGTKYILKGTVGDANAVAVTVQAGDDKKQEYQGLKSVPAEHREKVEKLLKSVSK